MEEEEEEEGNGMSGKQQRWRHGGGSSSLNVNICHLKKKNNQWVTFTAQHSIDLLAEGNSGINVFSRPFEYAH